MCPALMLGHSALAVPPRPPGTCPLPHVQPGPCSPSLTFHRDLGNGFDDSQAGHGHAGVVGGVLDVRELQDVPAHGHVILGRQVLRSLHPLHVGHGRPHGHAGDVDVAPGHDFMADREDGEARGHTANCGRDAQR